MDATYNAWRLTALSPLPLWAIALLAGCALAAVALAWRGLRGETRPRRRAALLALRAASAALAVFLLVEPAVELLQTARVRNRFAVLVDASRSMGFPVEAGGPTRSAAAGAFLADHRADLERLADRVDVEWYAFGGEVAPAAPRCAARGGRARSRPPPPRRAARAPRRAGARAPRGASRCTPRPSLSSAAAG